MTTENNATALTDETQEETPQDEDNTALTSSEGEDTSSETTGAEEDKTDGDKTDDKPQGAPDEYEDFQFPEGVSAKAEEISAFKDIAKELNLTQENAQKLVDLQVASAKADAEAQQEAWRETVSGWLGDAKKDKEIGGEKFNENLAVAKKALKEFGTDELKAALDHTGVGNHPEFLRFMYRVGKMVSNDKYRGGSEGSTEKTPVANRLFPSMK